MIVNFFSLLRVLSVDIGLNSSDVTYLVNRFHNEGISFVTSTLPKLWKNVMFSLKLGYFYRQNPAAPLTCFAWKSRSLRNFRSLLDKIFCPKTGKMLDNPCPKAVKGLRQISEYLYKLCYSFDDKRKMQAEAKYLSFEETTLRDYDENLDTKWTEKLRKNFETYYSPLSSAVPSDVFRHTRPRFGPGSFSKSSVDWNAVYERMRNSGLDVPFGPKTGHIPYWLYKQMPSKIIGLCPEEFRAFSGFFKPSESKIHNDNSHIYTREKRVCEVLFVPKNADGPRVISREPPGFLQAQMSFFGWASAQLERVTNGRIQFHDQSVNRALAQKGSIDGSLSTLDAKDASDSVSYKLCRSVFRNSPAMRWFIENTRSTHAILPSGKKIRLRKLSGMGSGLTFPIMSLLFHLAICTEVCIQLGLDYAFVSKQVHIFGDDVIVPTSWAEIAQEGLRKTGFCINTNKSFTTGPFRESCGGDYLNGVDVTPKRLKLMGANLGTPVEYRDVKGILIKDVSSVYLIERAARELCEEKLFNTAGYFYTRLENRLGNPLPNGVGDTPYLARFDGLGKASYVGSGEYSLRAIGQNQYTKVGLLLPVPVKTSEFERYCCPKKYLASTLKHSSGRLYEEVLTRSFGELAVPHAMKLKKRLGDESALHYVGEFEHLLNSANQGYNPEPSLPYKNFAFVMQTLYGTHLKG